MVGVAGRAVSADLAVDFGAAIFGVFILLQHQRHSAFSDHKARSAPVKGQGRRLWILGYGQTPACSQSRPRPRGMIGRLRTAGDHRVGIAVPDQPHGLPNGVGARGAGGYSRHAPDPGSCGGWRSMSGRHIGDHHGNEQRTKPCGDRAPAAWRAPSQKCSMPPMPVPQIDGKAFRLHMVSSIPLSSTACCAAATANWA